MKCKNSSSHLVIQIVLIITLTCLITFFSQNFAQFKHVSKNSLEISFDHNIPSQLSTTDVESIKLNWSDYLKINSTVISGLDSDKAMGFHWVNYSFVSGFGTEMDPYIISNVAFSGENASYALRIQYSNAFCIFSNCFFYNTSEYSLDSGALLIEYSGNITFFNCRFINNSANGVIIDHSHHLSFQSSTFAEIMGIGLHIIGSGEIQIANSNFYQILYDHIEFYYSETIIHSSNIHMLNDSRGFSAIGSENIYLSTNSFIALEENHQGLITIELDNESSLNNNITIIENTIMDGYSGIHLAINNPNKSLLIDNVFISDNLINCIYEGMHLEDVFEPNVTHNIISSLQTGVLLYNSQDAYLSDNFIQAEYNEALLIWSCNNTEVISNSLSSTGSFLVHVIGPGTTILENNDLLFLESPWLFEENDPIMILINNFLNRGSQDVPTTPIWHSQSATGDWNLVHVEWIPSQNAQWYVLYMNGELIANTTQTYVKVVVNREGVYQFQVLAGNEYGISPLSTILTITIQYNDGNDNSSSASNEDDETSEPFDWNLLGNKEFSISFGSFPLTLTVFLAASFILSRYFQKKSHLFG
ncbi:MAG: right-handed parallel beta-helix repeat-containing protein [Promethearchaeota archaeon]